MGYYIRILGTEIGTIPLEELREAATPGLLDMDREDRAGWQQLALKHGSGIEIAAIERNPLVPGELGYEELQEFRENISDCKPDSAVAWLHGYLPSVKVIYAFQLLNGTDVDDGWTLLHRVYTAVWKRAKGILQADGEGISNEDGFTILWQFDDGVTGSWNAGVLAQDGRWVHFEMDLGSQEHRGAFMRGEVPMGVRLL